MKNTITFLSFIIGGIIIIYANVKANQNSIYSVLGVILLFFGLYRINASLSSKVTHTDSIGNYRDEEE